MRLVERTRTVTPLPAATFSKSAFALVWSVTICAPNDLTSGLVPFSWASLPISTSVIPPIAAFSMNLRSALGTLPPVALVIGSAACAMPVDNEAVASAAIASIERVRRNMQLV